MATYYYHGDTETYHPKLNLLKPGANEIPDDLIDEAEAAVANGLLSHDESPPRAPQDEWAHTMDEPSASAETPEEPETPEEAEEQA